MGNPVEANKGQIPEGVQTVDYANMPNEFLDHRREEYISKIAREADKQNIFVSSDIQDEYRAALGNFVDDVYYDLVMVESKEQYNSILAPTIQGQSQLQTQSDSEVVTRKETKEQTDGRFDEIARKTGLIMQAICGKKEDAVDAVDSRGRLVMSPSKLGKLSIVLAAFSSFAADENSNFGSLLALIAGNDPADLEKNFETIYTNIGASLGTFRQAMDLTKTDLSMHAHINRSETEKKTLEVASLLVLMNEDQKTALIKHGLETITPENADARCKVIEEVALYTDLPIIKVISMIDAKMSQVDDATVKARLLQVNATLNGKSDAVAVELNDKLTNIIEALTVANVRPEGPLSDGKKLAGFGLFYWGAFTTLINALLSLVSGNPRNFFENLGYPAVGLLATNVGSNLLSGKDGFSSIDSLISGHAFSPERSEQLRKEAIVQGASNIVFRTNKEATQIFADSRFIGVLNKMIDESHGLSEFDLVAFKTRLHDEQPELSTLFDTAYIQKYGSNTELVGQNMVFLAHSYAALHITDRASFIENLGAPHGITAEDIPQLTTA